MRLEDIPVGSFFKWGKAYWFKMWHTNVCIESEDDFYIVGHFKNLSHKTKIKQVKKVLK